MKKLLLLAAIFALVFTGCEEEDGKGDGDNGETTILRIRNEANTDISNVVWQGVSFTRENADIIGTWTQMSNAVTPSVTFSIGDNSWSWRSSSSSCSGTWTRDGNTLTLNSNDTSFGYGTASLTGETLTVSLKYGITNFGPYQLKSNNLDKSIKFGNSVTKTVEAGSGYIFFKADSADYYTRELVVVEKDETIDFVFTNNTLIVDVNDTGKTVTLGGL